MALRIVAKRCTKQGNLFKHTGEGRGSREAANFSAGASHATMDTLKVTPENHLINELHSHV